MGKTTALSILSGERIPNLGEWENEDMDWNDALAALPAGGVRDHIDRIAHDEIFVATKPQAVDQLPKVVKGQLGDLLRSVDEEGRLEEVTFDLGLSHLLEREISELSGGELQRTAIAATVLKSADLYFFDEPTSYLDIHERIRVSRVIRELAERAPILVVEHDLAILDVLCDSLQILYGRKGGFGVMTKPRPTRTAINVYLDGYLKEENVRVRDKPIKFHSGHEREVERGNEIISWDGIEKKLGDFSLKTGKGSIHRAEVVGVVGPNGTGKTTLARILGGEIDPDAGWFSSEAVIAYKPQHVEVEHDGTVGEWLTNVIGPHWQGGEFASTLIRPLGIDAIIERPTNALSGGELQAVHLALCIGQDADLYLLDEPSAHLDASARMEAARAIRRLMESNERAALVIDHDVYMIDIISDRLLVFSGVGGIEGKAEGPIGLRKGMNRFLKDADVTFRRDHDSRRPRINKHGSRLDREQRSKGEYFYS